MKPCWYVIKFGKKCTNSGIKMDIVEKIILKEISKYKEAVLSDSFSQDIEATNSLQDQIDEKEAYLLKLKKALERLNDSYEMGDYQREEWLERKKKREAEIYRTKNEIYELKKRGNNKNQVNNEERTRNLNNFFDNLPLLTSRSDRNALYKTIIDSIIWHRVGDNIDVRINFK